MADSLVSKTRHFLENLGINFTQKRFLIAISGGIDSVVMAHVFHQLKINAALAHCNFTLRGLESDQDEEFVQELGKQLNYKVFTSRFKTKEYAHQQRVSTQMAARELRYAWFKEILAKENFDYVAIAQHTDDNIETLLLNISRGTGMAGLKGILPLKDKVVRPLLFSNRTAIEAYATQHAIQWREDASNHSDDYARNQIRHHILPVLKHINPSLETTFQDTTERLIASEQLLQSVLEDAKLRVVNHEGATTIINLTALQDFSQPLLLLAHILQSFGFHYRQSKEISQALVLHSGKEFYSATYKALKDRHQLIIQPRSENESASITIYEEDSEVEFAGRTYSLTYLTSQDQYLFSASTAYIDLAHVQFPLTLRKWKQADRIAPLGMQGKFKKVSDLFIDSKVNRFDKERIGLFVNADGTIIWVAGLRLDERFAIHKSTQKVLCITLH